MRFRNGLGLLVVLTVLAAFPLTARGGGLSLYEMGTPDVGLAAAGWAARAQDASTLFKNPAGMSLLEKSEFQGGLQLLYADMKFTPDVTSQPGTNGGNPVGLFPGASGFMTYKVTKDLAVGMGVFSYFGLALNYDDNWTGRYYIKNGTLVGVSFMPAVSYRVADWLSVGAGVNVMYGIFDTNVAVNNISRDPFSPDGNLKVKDGDLALGANFGVMLIPRDGTRIGVDYLSQVDLKFKDTPQFGNLGTIGGILGARGLLTKPLDLTMHVPQMLMVSLYQDVDPQWAFMANFGWQQWSKFGEIDLSVSGDDPKSLTASIHWQDTWHVAGGVQYRPNQKWTFSGGMAYDSSAVRDADRSVSVPVGDAIRFGIGTQWQWTEATKLGLAYELIWAGDMPVTQNRGRLAGPVSGTFHDTTMHFLTCNMSYRF